MNCPSYNIFFETISSKIRLDILKLLMKKPMSVSEICQSLHQEQSKISHNLKSLANCHFIEAEQKGKKRVYFLNKETIVPLMKLVEKHVAKSCCKNCPRTASSRNPRSPS